MEYEDRLTIPTPEGVDLELTLAGVGSRFASALLDYLIQLAIIIALGLVLGLGIGLSPGSSGFAAAVWIVLSFLLFVGYDITFEVLAAGRTPGKRANGLRVVREDGGPVTFPISAARNVLRIIDILPGMYLVGILAILISRRNQRLGDLAAGTLVVRERRAMPPEPVRVYAARTTVPAPAWDTSAIDEVELAAVRSFLARRNGLTDDARTQLAHELAARLQPKVGGGAGLDADSPELFLERLVAAKLGR
jgi:uncharacterized RDD family membrane protein YckC